MAEVIAVSYGVVDAAADVPEPPPPPEDRRQGRAPYEGLGQGTGGQLVRSCFISVGATMVDGTRLKVGDLGGESQSARQLRSEFFPMTMPSPKEVEQRAEELRRQALAAAERLEVGSASPRAVAGALAAAGALSARGTPVDATSRCPTRARQGDLEGAGGEPQGAFLALLLADASPTSARLLQHVERHRWNFAGASEVAARGRGYGYFIWCVLEMQRNIQTREDGEALSAPLARACQSFVGAQSRQGHMAEMYQLLTHFICNSVVWHEWHKFLRASFEDSRANQEAFLVPRLEQVWLRFQRLRGALAEIFGILDERFVWKHRLPKVGDLLLEHMRKRCFPLDLVSKNELFSQATIKDETLKQIKFAFGFS